MVLKWKKYLSTFITAWKNLSSPISEHKLAYGSLVRPFVLVHNSVIDIDKIFCSRLINLLHNPKIIPALTNS